MNFHRKILKKIIVYDQDDNIIALYEPLQYSNGEQAAKLSIEGNSLSNKYINIFDNTKSKRLAYSINKRSANLYQQKHKYHWLILNNIQPISLQENSAKELVIILYQSHEISEQFSKTAYVFFRRRNRSNLQTIKYAKINSRARKTNVRKKSRCRRKRKRLYSAEGLYDFLHKKIHSKSTNQLTLHCIFEYEHAKMFIPYYITNAVNIENFAKILENYCTNKYEFITKEMERRQFTDQHRVKGILIVKKNRIKIMYEVNKRILHFLKYRGLTHKIEDIANRQYVNLEYLDIQIKSMKCLPTKLSSQSGSLVSCRKLMPKTRKIDTVLKAFGQNINLFYKNYFMFQHPMDKIINNIYYSLIQLQLDTIEETNKLYSNYTNLKRDKSPDRMVSDYDIIAIEKQAFNSAKNTNFELKSMNTLLKNILTRSMNNIRQVSEAEIQTINYEQFDESNQCIADVELAKQLYINDINKQDSTKLNKSTSVINIYYQLEETQTPNSRLILNSISTKPSRSDTNPAETKSNLSLPTTKSMNKLDQLDAFLKGDYITPSCQSMSSESKHKRNSLLYKNHVLHQINNTLKQVTEKFATNSKLIQRATGSKKIVLKKYRATPSCPVYMIDGKLVEMKSTDTTQLFPPSRASTPNEDQVDNTKNTTDIGDHVIKPVEPNLEEPPKETPEGGDEEVKMSDVEAKSEISRTLKKSRNLLDQLDELSQSIRKAKPKKKHSAISVTVSKTNSKRSTTTLTPKISKTSHTIARKPKNFITANKENVFINSLQLQNLCNTRSKHLPHIESKLFPKTTPSTCSKRSNKSTSGKSSNTSSRIIPQIKTSQISKVSHTVVRPRSRPLTGTPQLSSLTLDDLLPFKSEYPRRDHWYAVSPRNSNEQLMPVEGVHSKLFENFIEKFLKEFKNIQLTEKPQILSRTQQILNAIANDEEKPLNELINTTKDLEEPLSQFLDDYKKLGKSLSHISEQRKNFEGCISNNDLNGLIDQFSKSLHSIKSTQSDDDAIDEVNQQLRKPFQEFIEQCRSITSNNNNMNSDNNNSNSDKVENISSEPIPIPFVYYLNLFKNLEKQMDRFMENCEILEQPLARLITASKLVDQKSTVENQKTPKPPQPQKQLSNSKPKPKPKDDRPLSRFFQTDKIYEPKISCSNSLCTSCYSKQLSMMTQDLKKPVDEKKPRDDYRAFAEKFDFKRYWNDPSAERKSNFTVCPMLHNELHAASSRRGPPPVLPKLSKPVMAKTSPRNTNNTNKQGSKVEMNKKQPVKVAKQPTIKTNQSALGMVRTQQPLAGMVRKQSKTGQKSPRFTPSITTQPKYINQKHHPHNSPAPRRTSINPRTFNRDERQFNERYRHQIALTHLDRSETTTGTTTPTSTDDPNINKYISLIEERFLKTFSLSETEKSRAYNDLENEIKGMMKILKDDTINDKDIKIRKSVVRLSSQSSLEPPPPQVRLPPAVHVQQQWQQQLHQPPPTELLSPKQMQTEINASQAQIDLCAVEAKKKITKISRPTEPKQVLEQLNKILNRNKTQHTRFTRTILPHITKENRKKTAATEEAQQQQQQQLLNCISDENSSSSVSLIISTTTTTDENGSGDSNSRSRTSSYYSELYDYTICHKKCLQNFAFTLNISYIFYPVQIFRAVKLKDTNEFIEIMAERPTDTSSESNTSFFSLIPSTSNEVEIQKPYSLVELSKTDDPTSEIDTSPSYNNYDEIKTEFSFSTFFDSFLDNKQATTVMPSTTSYQLENKGSPKVLEFLEVLTNLTLDLKHFKKIHYSLRIEHTPRISRDTKLYTPIRIYYAVHLRSVKMRNLSLDLRRNSSDLKKLLPKKNYRNNYPRLVSVNCPELRQQLLFSTLSNTVFNHTYFSNNNIPTRHTQSELIGIRRIEPDKCLEHFLKSIEHQIGAGEGGVGDDGDDDDDDDGQGRARRRKVEISFSNGQKKRISVTDYNFHNFMLIFLYASLFSFVYVCTTLNFKCE